MKKFFMVAVMAVAALSASAQVYLGTGLGFSSNTTTPDQGDGSTTTQFQVIPEIGYNITDNVAVGADFAYNTVKVTDMDATNTWAFDVYGRYNFAQAGPVKFFGELAVGYMGYKEGGATRVAVRPGATVALGKGVNLQTRFNLFQYVKDNEKAGKASHTNFGIFSGSSALGLGNDLQLALIFDL